MSIPVREDEGFGSVVAVVQAAQSRQVVSETVGRLIFVLVLTGLGALVLAAAGGLFMSRRAMRPVQEAFGRQRTFIADASHELKTPLTLIRADAEVRGRAYVESPDYRAYVQSQFTSGAYGWMWPFRRALDRWYDSVLAGLELPA